jgi:hypothetical protein
MLLTVTGAPLIFVTVTATGPLAVFNICVPTFKFVVLRLIALFTPVPRRLIVCGLLGALSVIVTVPVCSIAEVGLNRSEMVQDTCGATEVPQLLLCVNPALAAILVILRAAAPLLVKVTF